ncbi:MAG: DUF2309 domain-containing protein [Bacteroidetes bacterium]|nr:DUF2309 domain-containing protein [Bacteroidota bacterium]
MTTKKINFSEDDVLHQLKHYLPSQAPLKDFIHHNTLHAFQHKPFHKALAEASAIFGYKVHLQLDDYRQLYSTGQIHPEILEKIIRERQGHSIQQWKQKLIYEPFQTGVTPRIGSLRNSWKTQYKINLDKMVHPLLFRLLGGFLDQGISIRQFPVQHKGFLASVRELERNAYTGIFKTPRAKHLLLHSHSKLADLLHLLVGDETLYAQYLFDQQFAHPGWSGMVSVLEDDPRALLDKREINLHDLLFVELLMEIDALDNKFGERWAPLATHLQEKIPALFAPVPWTELDEVYALWQEAYEWSYYDQVLSGIRQVTGDAAGEKKSFDAFFCIDDRECSLRRHIEHFDPQCRTWGTPGFFNVEFYFQPEHGKLYTKVCPAPVQPKHLIREIGNNGKRGTDAHFTKHTHSLLFGWMISQTLGFWSALKLFLNIFRPSIGPATSYSFRHMSKQARLTIEHLHDRDHVHGLQIGFTVEEMADRVEGLLKSTGLVKDMAGIVYMVGHGASSINNTHYAGYDCGACSGRPGSVNARVISFMANHKEVRRMLAQRGIHIPEQTQFVGAMHDTTRDEIEYYDEDALTPENAAAHERNKKIMERALDANAKERSRRFVLINTQQSPEKIHEKVKLRSVSLFEPRPELNHATNALCIVGRRDLTRHLYLDRRSFMNSYDPHVDPHGKYLFNILKAAAPVCGGINLEYFFSRTDSYRLGAGTKLPHNVMGLVGVANGTDGDLRPGLPFQMVEVHDPVRLLIIVEQKPDVVLNTIQKAPETYEWFENAWVNLVAVHPDTRALHLFRDGAFVNYKPLTQAIPETSDVMALVESSGDNIPVHLLTKIAS